MLKELVDKGHQLEKEGKLYPVGYGTYFDLIKWEVHLYPDKDEVVVKEYSGENRARPKLANRSGGTIFPYPLADEAGYVLAITKSKKEELDKRANEKHEKFMALITEMKTSINDSVINQAISYLESKLKDRSDGSILKKFEGKDVYNKEWVSFVVHSDSLEAYPLHEMEAIKEFWLQKVSAKVDSGITGICSICGKENWIIKNFPSKVSLKGGGRQIASINRNAFVSHQFSHKDAPLGICLSCATKSAQTLDYLLDYNRYTIYEDKDASGKINKDSFRNQEAVFWLTQDSDYSVGDANFNPLDVVVSPISWSPPVEIKTTTELVNRFLKSPWTAREESLALDVNNFNLAIVSPNGPGRIAVRMWFHTPATKVKDRLITYFEALHLIHPSGVQAPPPTIKHLLEPMPDIDSNIAKSLIRTAYLGEALSISLYQAAINRIRVSGARDGAINDKKQKKGLPPLEVWYRLCSIIKLYLTYGKEDAESMIELDERRQNSAYQCGRLFALLEEMQRRAASSKLSSSVVERYYGAASTTPATVLPLLVNLATKAHMPKIRKRSRGFTALETQLEETMAIIDEVGGFPPTLGLLDQGEFALGFYHQRAIFTAEKLSKLKEGATNDGNASGSE